MTEILSAQGISKTFSMEGQTISVLQNISFSLKAGEVVALMGHSGAGKSTLLQILGLLEQPTQGVLKIQGEDVAKKSDFQRTLLRRQLFGFVYQSHRLLPDFTAEENIALPALMSGLSWKESQRRGKTLLEMFHLSHRAHHVPSQLSGGEQQRVAILRAIANGPQVLLADEPTGNLDTQTADQVFHCLSSLVKTCGMSALIATHNPELAQRMDRILVLKDGELISHDR